MKNMKYNPNIHHRRSIRLKGYDYSQAGSYFITICCQGRICRFGNIENGEMILNENDVVAQNETDIRAGASPAPTVFDIVGAYKSLVANGCLDIYKSKNEMMGK